jgi:D-glycero-D-manno-heptose 1,7-bisphosphate phosphatase
MSSALAAAVFLDRDGTLMENVEYCNDPERVHVFPGVSEGLRQLQESGFQNIIITNQSGIGRGWITMEQFSAVQDRLLKVIGPDLIEATYFCPDVPGKSVRRKPSAAMLLEAARDLGIDLGRSWFIGDQPTDMQCAIAGGVRPVLVQTGCDTTDAKDAFFVAKDFATAVEFILRNAGAR